MKKKAFTLIEMMVVLLIVGILMASLKHIFFPQSRNLMYGQNCANILYGKVNNFINSAITSKWLYTGGILIFPEYYHIDFNILQNEIAFWYTINWITNNHEIFQLSGQEARKEYCQTNEYQIILSWNNQNITITKWLQTKVNNSTFTLLDWWNSKFTWAIYLQLCNLDWQQCSTFSTYITDTRTKHIRHGKCINFTWMNNEICNKRDQ